MESASIEKGLEKILNRHGYGFHYSVLRLAHELSEENKTGWVFKAAEFPVQVPGGPGTRIDFVLQFRHCPIYLLGECKRANPALRNWCFVRAPYVRRNRNEYEPLFVERVVLDPDGTISASARSEWGHSDFHNQAYHIAREVKSQEKGDPYGSGRGAIEAAATQVCRALNGMVHFVANNPQVLNDSGPAYFLPVVFTTARVWASNVDLGEADLLTGTIDLEGTSTEQRDWVYYQYHLSPGIKHRHPPTGRPINIEGLLDTEYIRTIPIVSASGVRSFFTGLDWLPRYLEPGHYPGWP